MILEVQMKLSTKGRYGSRLMLELALNYGQGAVPVRELASKQEISVKYTEQLLAALKAAGLVKTIQGTKGGYELTKSPEKIRLGDVFAVLENVTLVECVHNPEYCDRHEDCVTRDLWSEMESALRRILDSTTLQNMTERQMIKRKEEGPMYFI
jgi:Rrf2 family protein